jgi:hypothetical protein
MTSILSSGLIEVAIGLAFVYLLLSLLCSVVNEWMAGILASRAKNLERGIRSLFTDGEFEKSKQSLTDALYDHGLIQSLYTQSGWDKLVGRKGRPSYIPSEMFATTMVNLFLPDPNATTDPVETVRGAINQLPASKGKDAMLALVSQGQKDLTGIRSTFEKWYDDCMDRVSGFYKRRTTLVLFFLGLATAVATNTDSFSIARTLWNNPALRSATAAAAEKYVKDYQPEGQTTPPSTPPSTPDASASPSSSSSGNAAEGTAATDSASGKSNDKPASSAATHDVKTEIDKLNSQLQALELPLGWPSTIQEPLLLRLLGWLFTAAALSLGAPFWFDLLNKFMVVRSTVKPSEKSEVEASKDSKR